MLIHKMTVDEAYAPDGSIKESDVKFFKTTDGSNAAYIKYNGKIFRVRVETLVYNDKGQIFAWILDKPTSAGIMYKIPGGSVEPNKPFIDQAVSEIHEEARFTVDNMVFTGIHYLRYYDTSKLTQAQRDKLAKQPIQNDGMVSFVYVGHYTGKFTGKIDPKDMDDIYKYGKWYDVKAIPLIEEHLRALRLNKLA